MKIYRVLCCCYSPRTTLSKEPSTQRHHQWQTIKLNKQHSDQMLDIIVFPQPHQVVESETSRSPFNNLRVGILSACVVIPHSNITVIYGFVYRRNPYCNLSYSSPPPYYCYLQWGNSFKAIFLPLTRPTGNMFVENDMIGTHCHHSSPYYCHVMVLQSANAMASFARPDLGDSVPKAL